MSPRVVALLVVLLGCSESGQLGPPAGAANDDDRTSDDDDATPIADLARGLTIDGVSLNQGVQTWLHRVDDPAPSGPIVAGRPGLLRAHVTPSADWEPRPITARLVWSPASGAPRLLESTATPTAPSTDGDLASTFSWELDAADVAAGANWQIALLETVEDPPDGPTDGALAPADGPASLNALPTGERLRVHLVPVRYDADGSGRLPDTSAAQLALYADWLYRVYPAAAIDLTVDPAPLPIDFAVRADGTGWGDLLYALTDVRYDRDLDDDVYVYGAFAPAESLLSYCGNGCYAGLSWRADDPSEEWGRTSTGLGFAGEGAAGTMIHELGHAHGRAHAPCNVAEPDAAYPHPEGQLGQWGWDLVERALIHPVDHRDLMGYCTPRWVSDYTWEALVSRMGFLAADASERFGEPPSSWRIVGVAPSGAMAARGTLRSRSTPAGEPVPVTWLDRDGAVIAEVVGRWRPFEGVPGGSLLVPEPPGTVVAIRTRGEVVPLAR